MRSLLHLVIYRGIKSLKGRCVLFVNWLTRYTHHPFLNSIRILRDYSNILSTIDSLGMYFSKTSIHWYGPIRYLFNPLVILPQRVSSTGSYKNKFCV